MKDDLVFRFQATTPVTEEVIIKEDRGGEGGLSRARLIRIGGHRYFIRYRLARYVTLVKHVAVTKVTKTTFNCHFATQSYPIKDSNGYFITVFSRET
jgi:hypothetical protein